MAPSGPDTSPNDTSTSLRVGLIDDHPVIRDALRQAIDDAMDMEVVAESDSTEEAFRIVTEVQPDVVIVDLSLQDGHGLDLLEQLRTHAPDTELLVFSMYDEKVYAERALQAGASGYLMKAVSLSEVLTALRRVAAGDIYLSSEMTSRVLQEMVDDEETGARFPIHELTDRELQVFQMLGRGLTVETIADRLDLARKTVETYRRRAKEKLGYETAAQVVSHAARWVLGQAEAADEE